MVLYAETPARRNRQILVDLAFVAWLLVAFLVAVNVHDAVDGVADQVRKVDAAGTSLSDGLIDAGDVLDGTPLVGDEVAAPFESAAASSSDVAQAGSDAADRIELVANLLGVATFLVLVLLLAPYYLPGRVRFIVAASAMARMANRSRAPSSTGAGGAGADTAETGDTTAEPEEVTDEAALLALRALVRREITDLLDVELPATGWRTGDRATVAALANLELRDQGLRPRF